MQYKIKEIRQFVDIDPQGRFYKFYRVTYEVNGTEYFIDIPEDEFSEERVREEIEKRVSTLSKLLS